MNSPNISLTSYSPNVEFMNYVWVKIQSHSRYLQNVISALQELLKQRGGENSVVIFGPEFELKWPRVFKPGHLPTWSVRSSLLLRLSRSDFKLMFPHDESFSSLLVSHGSVTARSRNAAGLPSFFFFSSVMMFPTTFTLCAPPTLFSLSSSVIFTVFSFSSLPAKPWDFTVSIQPFKAAL